MHRLIASVLAVGCFTAIGSAQEKKSEPERLFRSRETLELTLKAPLKELFKNRDTLAVKPVNGTLEFKDAKAGDTSIPIVLETRGHFRLKSSTCSFAPLKVRFDKEKAKGTEFSGQGGLKLVTHCLNGTRYEQNLLLEESIYRIHNLLTPFSFRTRLAKIHYIPTDDTTKQVTRYGFFLENDNEMAKRNQGTVLMQTGGKYEEMDQPLLDLMMIWEYFIGNTDWSVAMIHNFRVLAVEGKENYYPVAYDFDFSGLVNASYAVPDYRLPIKSVKQRLYRGPCKKATELWPTIELFRAKKDSMYAIIRAIPDFEPGRVKEAIGYLDDFFNDAKTAKDFDNSMGYACRGS